MERELNFFQSWLYRTLQRWSKELEAFGNRCAGQNPVKQKAKPKTSEPEKESLTWEQLNANRRTIKIMGKDVPIKKGDSIY